MSLGLTKSEVLDSAPIDLEYIFEAERLRLKKQDEEAWRNGIYFQNAMEVAIDRRFNGRKATSRYFEEPLLKEALMTEEEKEARNKKYLKEFFAGLKAMQKNFELEKENERARVNENAG